MCHLHCTHPYQFQELKKPFTFSIFIKNEGFAHCKKWKSAGSRKQNVTGATLQKDLRLAFELWKK